MLGCVAQQEGEKIFDRAPYVSLVSGSASYRKLPEMLTRLEAGERRITGLDDRQTEETFETEFTSRQNPYRAYITIIEGCDKFCAYCVVPYTRGKERSRTSNSVLTEARRIADQGYTEIQLLGQNVNSYKDPEGKLSFAELLAAVGQVPGIRRVRFTTSHPRDFTREIVEAIDAVPTLCDHVHLAGAVGVDAECLKAMAREYTREWYLERIAWIKSARRPDFAFDGHYCGLSGRDGGRVYRDHGPAGRGRVRLRVRIQVLGAAQYAGAGDDRLNCGNGEGEAASSAA